MSDPVLALNILFTVLSDASYALLFGCLIARYWIRVASPDKEIAGLLQPLSVGSVAGLLLSHLVRPWFASASMSGSSGFTENLRLVPEVLLATHQGTLWFINSVGLALLLMIMLVHRRPTWLALAALLIVTCAKAASGHSANKGDFTLEEFAMLLHLVSIAVWAGTIIASGLIIFPRLAGMDDPDAVWTYGRLLSRTVTWALIVIVFSGIYISSGVLSGHWTLLWHSGWGGILIAKVVFVTVAVALGATTRFTCLNRPACNERVGRIVQLVRAEAVAMILVICLSAVLANTSPPMAA